MSGRATTDHALAELIRDRGLEESLRRVHLELSRVLIELDQRTWAEDGWEGYEPVHLGRWFLAALLRLVEEERVGIGQVTDAVRAVVAERAPAQTRSKRLAVVLVRVDGAEALARLLARIDQELTISHAVRRLFEESALGVRGPEARRRNLAALLEDLDKERDEGGGDEP